MSRFLLGSPYGSTFFQAVCLRHSHFWKEPPVEIGIVNWTSFISCSFFGSLQWIICLYLTSSLTTLLLYKPSARVSLGSVLFPFQHYFLLYLFSSSPNIQTHGPHVSSCPSLLQAKRDSSIISDIPSALPWTHLSLRLHTLPLFFC